MEIDPAWEDLGGAPLSLGRGPFLGYSVAARGASHQTDPLPREPAGDVSLPELLGTTHRQQLNDTTERHRNDIR